MVQALRPNAGRKKQKNARKSAFLRKKYKLPKKYIFLLDIPSSYAKILGETNVQPREFPQSGSKTKDGERKKERKKTESW